MESEKIIQVTYKNHRGEIGIRKIVPEKIWFGTTEYHPEPQWLLDGLDVDKNAKRTFALKDCSNWEA